MSRAWLSRLSRWPTQYSMLVVLLLLSLVCSVATLQEQHPTGEAAGRRLAGEIQRQSGPGARVLIVAGSTAEDAAFADRAQSEAEGLGLEVVGVARGAPGEARAALVRLVGEGKQLHVIGCTHTAASWLLFRDLEQDFPALGQPRLVTPPSTYWPTFLKADNLLNIASQIAIIAILAIGMTVVIITGGIDLSVGSLIALGSVVATLLIERFAGGTAASIPAMTGACLAALALTGAIGMGNGVIITTFRVPPFLVTLSAMLVVSGVAYLLTRGESVSRVPESFVWLAVGTVIPGLPNAVLLMGLLYTAAHVLMTRTVLGRHLYAVGGNPEAARLSGLPVRRRLLFAYALSGFLAGLGGVVMASQLKSGAPSYGQMYELYVIAAVVVGGTSLAGGEGTMLGTLIGAFLIAVINNGMNLANIESYTQKVVLGGVILGAVLVDQLRRRFR